MVNLPPPPALVVTWVARPETRPQPFRPDRLAAGTAGTPKNQGDSGSKSVSLVGHVPARLNMFERFEGELSTYRNIDPWAGGSRIDVSQCTALAQEVEFKQFISVSTVLAWTPSEKYAVGGDIATLIHCIIKTLHRLALYTYMET